MERRPGWRANLSFFLALCGYWMLLSFLDRIVFAISVWHKIEDPIDVLYAFWHGIKLDLSLMGYLQALPFLFFFIQQLCLKISVSPWILRGYVFVPTVLFAAVTTANLPLYEAWGEKISKRAITLGMGAIGGVSNSIDFGMVWRGAVVLAVFFLCAHYFYHLVVVRYAKYAALPNRFVQAAALVVGAALIFSLIRGGYGRATLNQSSVYFSDDNIANHVAVNTYWSFLKDLTKSTKRNPYKFMSEQEASRVAEQVLRPANDFEEVLTTKRPNVILVLLEGMVAQVFEDLGGEKDVTPKMKQLMDEGISFRRAYAAADRSDKGMIAAMSGFPAQGPESIIKYIPKHEKLPAVGQIFDSLGYATSFYHGGQSEFYNFKSFMFTHGVEHVVDDADFPLGAQRNSWGVYDHVVAQRMLHDLGASEKPFFSIFYTIVNHEPFHLSPGYKFGNSSKANAYRSTAYYTDTMLFNFIEKAKQQPWYEESVVVVTSDHGHVYPQEKFGLERPERYHIPLFVFGGALKDEYKGKKVDEVVSQLDVASTLAGFVGAPAGRFRYSQNLFARNRAHTAFFNANGTFGVVNSEAVVSYDMLRRDVGYTTVPKSDKERRDSLLHIAKGYYQRVFEDFLAY